MTKTPLSVAVLIFFGLFLGKSLAAGDVERRSFEYNDNRGAVHDYCLNVIVPVTIKKLDRDLFFVKVEKRFAGNVRAKTYGEARDIACSRKTDLILYYREP